METQNKEKLVELERNLALHEVQCEERWKTNFNRLQDIEAGLKRIENRIIVGGGSVIIFLAGIVIALLEKQL